MSTKDDTKAIVKDLGGPKKLAEELSRLDPSGITKQAVSLWSVIPLRRCVHIEQISNGKYKCHELRPDVFPVPEKAA